MGLAPIQLGMSEKEGERWRKMEKDRSGIAGRPIRRLMAKRSTCGCRKDGKEMHEAIFLKKSPVLAGG